MFSSHPHCICAHGKGRRQKALGRVLGASQVSVPRCLYCDLWLWHLGSSGALRVAVASGHVVSACGWGPEQKPLAVAKGGGAVCSMVFFFFFCRLLLSYLMACPFLFLCFFCYLFWVLLGSTDKANYCCKGGGGILLPGLYFFFL